MSCPDPPNFTNAYIVCISTHLTGLESSITNMKGGHTLYTPLEKKKRLKSSEYWSLITYELMKSNKPNGNTSVFKLFYFPISCHFWWGSGGWVVDYYIYFIWWHFLHHMNQLKVMCWLVVFQNFITSLHSLYVFLIQFLLFNEYP